MNRTKEQSLDFVSDSVHRRLFDAPVNSPAAVSVVSDPPPL